MTQQKIKALKQLDTIKGGNAHDPTIMQNARAFHLLKIRLNQMFVPTNRTGKDEAAMHRLNACRTHLGLVPIESNGDYIMLQAGVPVFQEFLSYIEPPIHEAPQEPEVDLDLDLVIGRALSMQDLAAPPLPASDVDEGHEGPEEVSDGSSTESEEDECNTAFVAPPAGGEAESACANSFLHEVASNDSSGVEEEEPTI